MVYRIGIGVVAIALILAIVLGDVWLAANYPSDWPLAALLHRGSLIPISLLILCLMAARELGALLRQLDSHPQVPLVMVGVTLFLLQPWVEASGALDRVLPNGGGPGGGWVVFSVIMPTILLVQVLRCDPRGAIRDTGATLLMVVYLGALPSFGVHLRCATHGGGSDGAWLLLITILVTKCSDIGGYLVGSVVGRHRLIPSISPSKTYEGTIGGILLSCAVASALVAQGRAAFISTGTGYDRGWGLGQMIGNLGVRFSQLGYSKALMFGGLTAIIALFGDLFESCIKREAGVKDSACRIPTYGGILDLLDSPCATLPVAWFLLTQVWRLG